MEAGIIKKSGAWFTYEGDQLGQGKEKAREFLKQDPDLAETLEDRIMQELKVGPYASLKNAEGGEGTAPAAAEDSLDPDDQPIGLSPNFDDDDEE